MDSPAVVVAFWVLAAIRVIDWNGVPAALTVFHDISEQLAAEAALKTSERRLAAQSDALTALTARYTNPNERFDERLRSILEIAAHTLRVERLNSLTPMRVSSVAICWLSEDDEIPSSRAAARNPPCEATARTASSSASEPRIIVRNLLSG